MCVHIVIVQQQKNQTKSIASIFSPLLPKECYFCIVYEKSYLLTGNLDTFQNSGEWIE